MTRASSIAVLCLSASLAGCAREGPALPPPPPHGGTAFPLPGGKGFVEVVRQEAPDQAGRTRIVVFFIDSGPKPLPSAPTTASLVPRGRKATAIALRPTQAADPSTSGGLASTPFDEPGDVAGLLSATIDGKPATIPISLR